MGRYTFAPVRTFSIQTLGCKVNHYESEQIATLLRSWGLEPAEPDRAQLRIIHTCSVTTEAASKSRQTLRRAIRLPILQGSVPGSIPITGQRVIVTGCWATSHPAEAAAIAGPETVLTHHQDVAQRLANLLSSWGVDGPPAEAHTQLVRRSAEAKVRPEDIVGTRSLPLLEERQAGHQRAFLKIQDGCDAHCTYCIIPSLRPGLWSKPHADVLSEARRMIEVGHREIVLTGIFLSAYGQATALRRRQTSGGPGPLASLVESLCQIPGLRRLRLSSLEPGDLNDDLLNVLRSCSVVVPHFHLPLQSGSDRLLRRMNRQYSRDEYLRMIDRVQTAFDRPALTTDIIAGFPGETDEDFEQTLGVANKARFIHIHAFPFSPRPGTAAARWTSEFTLPKVTSRRIDQLNLLGDQFSLEFRNSFVGQTAQLLVERDDGKPGTMRHGRCERYFDVHFEGPAVSTGDLVTVRIERVTPSRTFGSLVELE
jgi:threonylcarbamoyladenosine tRNA methylthiotransferase MtaB